jgi:RimJ/RimL family protein N-acetyltransferase
MFLETERLRLRNVAAKDAEIMYDYRNNELCARYQRGQTKDYPGIVALVERRKNDVMSVEEPFLVAVALKDSDEMIGEIVVMPNDGTISLGYTFSYKHHRKGYAFESLTALINTLHEQYPEWDFISFTEPENVPSMNLLKKLGYNDMGYLPSKESQVFGKWTTPATEVEIAEAVTRR